jgi:hypothetical protein
MTPNRDDLIQDLQALSMQDRRTNPPPHEWVEVVLGPQAAAEWQAPEPAIDPEHYRD